MALFSTEVYVKSNINNESFIVPYSFWMEDVKSFRGSIEENEPTGTVIKFKDDAEVRITETYEDFLKCFLLFEKHINKSLISDG